MNEDHEKHSRPLERRELMTWIREFYATLHSRRARYHGLHTNLLPSGLYRRLRNRTESYLQQRRNVTERLAGLVYIIRM